MKKIKGHFWSPSNRPHPSPPANKTFSRFQKGLWSRHVLKVQYTFTKTINGKSSIGPLLDMLRISLRGIKHFQGFKKASPRGMF